MVTKRWLAMLKLTRPMYWMLWFTPLSFGYLSRGTEPQYVHLVSMMAWMAIWDTFENVHNYLADRDEDRMNIPHGARLPEIVGIERLRKAFSWRTIVPLAVLYYSWLFWTGAGVWTTILLTIAGLIALMYNVGPRFKARGRWAQFAIVAPYLLLYWAGHSWGRGLTTPPSVIVLASTVILLAAVQKDLPDVSGDVGAGLSNWYSPGLARRVYLAGLIFLAPYVLTLIAVLTAYWPMRMVAVFAVFPLAVLMWLHTAFVDMRQRSEAVIVYWGSLTYVNLLNIVLFVLWNPIKEALILGPTIFLLWTTMVGLRLDARFEEPGTDWGSLWAALLRISRRWRNLATA